MKYALILWLIFTGALIFGCYLDWIETNNKKLEILSNCQPTNSYMVNDDGVIGRVYDCSDKRG